MKKALATLAFIVLAPILVAGTVGFTPEEAVFSKLDATAAPAVTDDSNDGYVPGSSWVDVTNDKAYVCVDATVGAAVWTEVTGGSGGLTPPGSSTDDALVRWDGTSADTVDDSAATLSDAGDMVVNDLTISTPSNIYALSHNSFADTHNLTTDIDHNSLTNTHNLTTDIDHNSLTNTHGAPFVLAGTAGGQLAISGTEAGDPGTWKTTSNATLGLFSLWGLGIQLTSNGTAPTALDSRGIDMQTSRSAAGKTIVPGAGTYTDNSILSGRDNYYSTASGTPLVLDNTIGGGTGNYMSAASSNVQANTIVGGSGNYSSSVVGKLAAYNVIGGWSNQQLAGYANTVFGRSNFCGHWAGTGGGTPYYNLVGGQSTSVRNDAFHNIAWGNANRVDDKLTNAVFGDHNESLHNGALVAGEDGNTSANYDFIMANGGTNYSVNNVYLRGAGDTASLHIGRQTNQAAPGAGETNTLFLHSINANQQSNFYAVKAATTMVTSGTDELGIATVTVAYADVRTMGGSPVTVIPAPGSGKAIVVLHVYYFLDWSGGDAYDRVLAGPEVRFKYDGSDSILTLEAGTLMNATSDQGRFSVPDVYDDGPTSAASSFNLLAQDNLAVVLTTDDGSEFYTSAGDSPVKVRLKYTVIDLTAAN